MSRSGPLVALAAATVASTGGTRLSAIAIPWLVLTTTGNPVLTGAVSLAEMLPYVLAKALGGPLIDRVGARRVAMWCDACSVAAIALLPILFWAGLLSIWVLTPVVALIGVLRAPSDASKQAMVPRIAELSAVPLERVTGVLGASDRLAGTLGAAGAGVLIAIIGPVPALIANAAAFSLSALIVRFGVPLAANTATAEPAPEASQTYGAAFAAGWAVLRGDPVLVGLVVMIAFTNLFDQAYATLLLPVWVRSSGLDVSWVGILLAVFSGAAIAGAALAAAVAERVPRLTIYTIGFVCAGPVPLMTLALGAPLPVILPAFVLSGFAAGFLNPIIGALLFERIPAPMVGRVIALVGAQAWALIPFGGLYAGLLVENVGVAVALGATASLYLLATLAPVALPSFRQMNRKAPVQA
ncbi:MFS transporter [Devosia salina]|uniref:MFS transporter n=1 Tax=Devosia salina TaxID=2860336 RepID=A0ABX8WPU7_9HYPH|nr:MFS transporter [Devosia salina]QYO78695.1 MFS transporter [Devosia salina]